MGASCCFGDRSAESSLDAGKSIYTKQEVLKFPDGVAAEKLDVRDMEFRGLEEKWQFKKAVHEMLMEKDVLELFQILLNDIRKLDQTDGLLDLEEIAAKVQALQEGPLADKKLEVCVCNAGAPSTAGAPSAAAPEEPEAQDTPERQSDPELTPFKAKPDQHFCWLLFIDREKAPEFTAQFLYVPKPKPKPDASEADTASKAGCGMM